MCGIAGKYNFDPGRPVERETLERMGAAVAHRGPDEHGVFARGNIGLAHRRLSIIDLAQGRQPLSNEDGTVWVTYNGEIYNFQALRRELIDRGHVFRTNTDTEVLVHLWEDHGPEMVERLCGMFAFAIWDEKSRRLFLARDRVGIKPLYYATTGDALIFASEIKSILRDDSFEPRLNRAAIDRFLTFHYLPGDATLFQNVQKLEPGHVLLAENGSFSVRRYWDLDFSGPRVNGNFETAVEQLTALLDDVVREHMIADVPVGVLLSGGVDSTALLSIAVEQGSRPPYTFTIGFDDATVTDERHYARLAAERFGTEHHEISISPGVFADFLPAYVRHMEEPVCEPPAVALYHVSKLAREHVKVVLSGEGGDEAFAGYSTYRNQLLLERLNSLPAFARCLATGAGRGLTSAAALPRYRRYVESLAVPLEERYYSRTASPFQPFNARPEAYYTDEFLGVVDKEWSLRPLRELFETVRGHGPLEKMLYVDSRTWLPDDLLIKADKITMANSLELRVPLLDHRVLEYAARLPPEYKLRGRTTKRILKRAFEGKVPREILERPKGGFPIPYARWFRDELQGFLHDVLLDPVTLGRGYFRREGIESLLASDDSSQELFCLLVLELWHREFLP